MLVAVAAVKGSPGVTTLALALGAQRPGGQRAVVVEADPAGGDLAARFGLPGQPGLVTLAAAARREQDPGLLEGHTQRLLGGRVSVVLGAAGAEQARAAVGALTGAGLGWATRPDVVVIMDCGRWDAGSPTTPLLRAADAVLLVVRPRADELAHLAARLPQIAGWRGIPGLVLAGRDGYRPQEIRHALGVPVMAVVPADPRTAGVLRGQARWRGRTGRWPLLRAAAGIARTFSADRPHPVSPGDAATPAPAIARSARVEQQPMAAAASGNAAAVTSGARR